MNWNGCATVLVDSVPGSIADTVKRSAGFAAKARRALGPMLVPIVAVLLLLSARLSAAQERPRGPAPRHVDSLWRAGPPSLSVGGDEVAAGSPFANIQGVVRLADGRIVVADNGAIRLRFFAADGRELRSTSGKGEGPGEVLSFEGLALRADSLYAYDARGAVHIFSLAGKFVRSIRWGSLRGARLFHERPEGVTLHSGLVGRRWLSDLRTLPPGDPIRVELRRGRGEGVPVTSLGVHTSAKTFKRTDDRYVRILGYSPGLRVAVFTTEICYSTRERFLVQCVDTIGRPTRRIERSRAAKPVTKAMDSDLRTGMSGRRPDGSSRYEGSLRTHRELMARTVLIARTLPAIGRLVAASSGDLWIADYLAPTDGLPLSQGGGIPASPTRWTVVDPAGRTRAIATLPARFRLEDAGVGWVLGVRMDEDDVERVELLPILAGR